MWDSLPKCLRFHFKLQKIVAMSNTALLAAASSNESITHRTAFASVLSICESQIDDMDCVESSGQGSKQAFPVTVPFLSQLRPDIPHRM